MTAAIDAGNFYYSVLEAAENRVRDSTGGYTFPQSDWDYINHVVDTVMNRPESINNDVIPEDVISVLTSIGINVMRTVMYLR